MLIRFALGLRLWREIVEVSISYYGQTVELTQGVGYVIYVVRINTQEYS